jgi:ribosomal protein L34E
MKGLKIANELAGMASKKEKDKKPGLVIMIHHGKPENEAPKCPHCGAPQDSPAEESGESESEKKAEL